MSEHRFDETCGDDSVSAVPPERRLHALAVLESHDDSLTLADLAEEVAVREYGRPLTDISPQTVLDVYLSLYYDHLPSLVEAGLATYDQESDRVVPAGPGSDSDSDPARN